MKSSGGTVRTRFSLYLLHAPYGSNIIGYRTASLRFLEGAGEFKLGGGSHFGGLPNNPANVNPAQNAEQLKLKRDQLLLKLYQEEIIDQATYELAAAEPLPEGQRPFPYRRRTSLSVCKRHTIRT